MWMWFWLCINDDVNDTRTLADEIQVSGGIHENEP